VPYFSGLVGNGLSTSITVTHSLNTRDVVVQVWDASTFEDVEVDVFRTTLNTVTLIFASAPATNSFRVAVVPAGGVGAQGATGVAGPAGTPGVVDGGNASSPGPTSLDGGNAASNA
jgi:hypothetical protein